MTTIAEREHAERLLNMLQLKNPCRACPCDTIYGGCKVCRAFVGISTEEDLETSLVCPCDILGPKEAIKRTWLALEEKGYI